MAQEPIRSKEQAEAVSERMEEGWYVCNDDGEEAILKWPDDSERMLTATCDVVSGPFHLKKDAEKEKTKVKKDNQGQHEGKVR